MTSRERMPEPSNPLGMDGIEFIEYATSQPQAFGDLLQRMGFVPLARHRSREVLLYRQGPMNLIVNSHGATTAMPTVSAVALRVRDAAFAHKHSLELGAWDMPTRASAMELSIPGIHGVGDSLIYFVDRYRDFSIYDVDFIPLPGADPRPSALAGLHYFGVVQAILGERTRDWVDFYRHLFGFTVLPRGQYFGVLPKGTLLESLPQVLSPADRAASGRRRHPVGRRPGAARSGRGERAGSGARAAGARHRVRRPRRGAAERKGRADPVLSGRRHL